jgi:hypothetical protein
MKPYQPSQIVPAKGAILLLAAILIGGAVIGALVSLLANLIYLILVFPIVMGAAGGALVASAVRSGKIRNATVALLGGLLVGVVIYASMWAVDYLQARSSLASGSNFSFVDYVLVMDRIGVSVGRLGNSNSINLGPTFSWVYWGVELLIIMWLAATTGRAPAQQPFCEACDRWYAKPALVGTLGASRQKEVLGYLENSQFQKLGEELQSNPALPNVGVFLATCGDGCADGEAYLAASQQTRNSKGNAVAKDLVKGLITPSQLQDLRRGIEERRALYGFDSAPVAK